MITKYKRTIEYKYVGS